MFALKLLCHLYCWATQQYIVKPPEKSYVLWHIVQVFMKYFFFGYCCYFASFLLANVCECVQWGSFKMDVVKVIWYRQFFVFIFHNSPFHLAYVHLWCLYARIKRNSYLKNVYRHISPPWIHSRTKQKMFSKRIISLLWYLLVYATHA